MIPVNELRVGNYVMMKGQLTFIDIPLVLTFADEMKAVELTPEILEKLGFKGIKPHPKDIYGKERLSVILTKDRNNISSIEVLENYGSKNGLAKRTILDAPLKHLHQLQNLYFALTGEEIIKTVLAF